MNGVVENWEGYRSCIESNDKEHTSRDQEEREEEEKRKRTAMGGGLF